MRGKKEGEVRGGGGGGGKGKGEGKEEGRGEKEETEGKREGVVHIVLYWYMSTQSNFLTFFTLKVTLRFLILSLLFKFFNILV